MGNTFEDNVHIFANYRQLMHAIYPVIYYTVVMQRRKKLILKLIQTYNSTQNVKETHINQD